MLDFTAFDILTFDCYGTLIDWERGIVEALRPVFSRYDISMSDEEILEIYAELETMQETGGYVNYRRVLQQVMEDLSAKLGFAQAFSAHDVLAESIRNWKPFHDTVPALRELKKRYKLAIISNIDDDLVQYSLDHLEVSFDWVITAQQARSYKPALNNFYYAIQKMNSSIERVLHIAQSIHHDIRPATKLGITTVWVNRRHDRPGFRRDAAGACPAGHRGPGPAVACPADHAIKPFLLHFSRMRVYCERPGTGPDSIISIEIRRIP